MKQPFTFIDLFAGIGGMRIAFEKAGCECVFTSEIDKHARKTYQDNFGVEPSGDITKIASKDIPDHDILVGGFPCQSFSTAGARKGFAETRGTLFFEIERIIRDKQPKAFLLENVKGLLSHDNGNTFKTVINALRSLDYTVFFEVLNSKNHVPQNRERVFIVGFKGKAWFNYPKKHTYPKPKIKDILESNVDGKYTISARRWETCIKYKKKLIEDSRGKVQKDGYSYNIVELSGRTGAICTYNNWAIRALIEQENQRPRKLLPIEYMRLMGFDQLKPDFKIHESDSQAYKQFGNSVVVPLVYDIAKEMIKSLNMT